MQAVAEAPPGQIPTGRHDTLRLGVYFGILLFAFNFGVQSGLPAIPIQFYLKDRLHVSPQTMAMFQLVTSVPLYIGFTWGFIRDRWRPFGLGDRGHFLIFAPISAGLYLWLSFGEISFQRLLAAVLLATLTFRVLYAACWGLVTEVAQARLMTGRLSVLGNTVAYIPGSLALLAGGWLSTHVSARGVFGLGAAITMVIFLQAFWRERSVFGAWPAAVPGDAPDPQCERGWQAVQRLLRNRPIWPAILIWALWSFAPGFQTPMFYYLTNTIKASGTQVGLFNALFGLFFIPTMIAYGFLCRRFALRRLLFWGTLIAIPQMIPLVAIHTPGQAEVAAALIGLMGGIATAGYFDLIMRSCPKGLEGTGILIADTVYWVAVRGGDVFATWLFARGGFVACVEVTTAVYASILLVLTIVPRLITSTREGEPPPAACRA